MSEPKIIQTPKPPLSEETKKQLFKSTKDVANILQVLMQVEMQKDQLVAGRTVSMRAGHQGDVQQIDMQIRAANQRLDAAYHTLNDYWQYVEV